MLDVLIIAGFAFSAYLIYFVIGKLIDRIDPFEIKEAETEKKIYHIAVQDLVFLREIDPFLDMKKCAFYTGSADELEDNLTYADMDAVILSDDTIHVSGSQNMHKIRGRYYSSSLSIESSDIDLQLVSQKPHTVTIYCRERFMKILDEMIHKGVLNVL